VNVVGHNYGSDRVPMFILGAESLNRGKNISLREHMSSIFHAQGDKICDALI
jgi:hypothetical protein